MKREFVPPPPEAAPVIEVLRKSVKRPRELPRGGRFDFGGPPWIVCPAGLHPHAPMGEPGPLAASRFLRCSVAEVSAFMTWWDLMSLWFPKEATDAVWPPAGGVS